MNDNRKHELCGNDKERQRFAENTTAGYPINFHRNQRLLADARGLMDLLDLTFRAYSIVYFCRRHTDSQTIHRVNLAVHNAPSTS